MRVVGVHPPSTRTERILSLMKSAAKTRYGDELRTDDLIKDKIFGKPIEPEQVADTVVYLASERAGHLSEVVFNLGAN